MGSDMALDLKPRKITVTEFRRMAEVGILRDGERVELLDGALVEMSPIGRLHWVLHGRAVAYLNRALAGRAFVAGNASVALGQFDEPEPDILIVPPLDVEYLRRDPRPDEVCAIVEISDSSLRKDTGVKRRLYGRFGIADYLVIDVHARVMLRYTSALDAGYGEPQALRAGDTFRLTALPDVELEVEPFLPPAE